MPGLRCDRHETKLLSDIEQSDRRDPAAVLLVGGNSYPFGLSTGVWRRLGNRCAPAEKRFGHAKCTSIAFEAASGLSIGRRAVASFVRSVGRASSADQAPNRTIAEDEPFLSAPMNSIDPVNVYTHLQ